MTIRRMILRFTITRGCAVVAATGSAWPSAGSAPSRSWPARNPGGGEERPGGGGHHRPRAGTTAAPARRVAPRSRSPPPPWPSCRHRRHRRGRSCRRRHRHRGRTSRRRSRRRRGGTSRRRSRRPRRGHARGRGRCRRRRCDRGRRRGRRSCRRCRGRRRCRRRGGRAWRPRWPAPTRRRRTGDEEAAGRAEEDDEELPLGELSALARRCTVWRTTSVRVSVRGWSSCVWTAAGSAAPFPEANATAARPPRAMTVMREAILAREGYMAVSIGSLPSKRPPTPG